MVKRSVKTEGISLTFSKVYLHWDLAFGKLKNMIIVNKLSNIDNRSNIFISPGMAERFATDLLRAMDEAADHKTSCPVTITDGHKQLVFYVKPEDENVISS